VPERTRNIAAVDLGASSGRVVLARVGEAAVELEVVHRFENTPVWLPDGLHWNLLATFAQTLAGLSAAAEKAGGALDSIGIDTWGCDYALLDEHNRMLGVPYHYRDTARTSEQVLADVHAVVPVAELYARTGMQTLPFNTIFQLASQRDSVAMQHASRIALIPDLLGQWLTGTLANELTAASTTGLLDARSGAWARDLIARLGIAEQPFSGEVVPPGFLLGDVLADHAGAGLAVGSPVHTVGGHDTASAFAAAPVSGPHCALLSSGTWSLLGVEVDEPCLTEEAAAYNFTNERGVAGNVRLLRNIMGLWLLQECQRAWSDGSGTLSFEELHKLARDCADVALFDPDDASLFHPGTDMPQRITALCVAAGQAVPEGHGALVRSILLSLACKYRLVLERLEAVTERSIEVISIVGGGIENELLCQMTADITGREVAAGPHEATALGNALVQMLALGDVANFDELRELAAVATTPRRYEPSDRERSEETYQRFLSITGLRVGSHVKATA
jgi:rhamnulokinase